MAVVETVQHGLDAVEQREQTGVSLFCPEHGQSLGHTAPKTPGCAPATQAPTRPVSTEDDGPGQYLDAFSHDLSAKPLPLWPLQ